MKNRAKCKLCNDIIESFHRHDYVTCKCGKIAIDGGPEYYKASAKDFKNFLRVDDEGNEIEITFQEKNDELVKAEEPIVKPTKKELLRTLEEMVKTFNDLPQEAMMAPINHYDFSSLLSVLLVLFSDDSST